MATIYSLICFGGKDGKTVTFTDAGDVVNLTNHGLRDATPIVFTDNAGNTLPTGLSKNTTYYAKSTGANTFTLYTAADLVTQVTFTGTGSGTHKVKSRYYYDLSDKSRWTNDGTEYIFDSLNSWHTHRTTTVPTTLFNDEICEIGMAWNDIASGLTFNVRANTVLVTTYLNGSRSGAFHSGVVGAGYIYNGNNSGGPAINTVWFNTFLDGFTVKNASGNTGVEFSATGCGARKLICNQSGNHVFAFSQNLTYAINCIAVGGTGDGFYVRAGVNAYLFNNISAKQSTYGFNIASTSTFGFYYNNISIGNTTANWSAKPTSLYSGSGNAGLVGDTTVWNTTGVPIVVIATTDFVDYANNDFRPAAITSPQVETGTLYPGDYEWDIADDARPSYSGSLYNTAVTAGSFVAGLSYTIATKGTTDFTACGATTNAVTFTDAGDTVGWTAHTLNNNDLIYFSVITTTTGISIDTLYYVVNKAANTFQVALTSGGSAIALTTNGTGTVVLPTFKATGVGTGTGTATLNAKYDIGPYEYDLGYGPWPLTRTIDFSGLVSGSQVVIYTTNTTTELARNDSTGTTYSYNAGTSGVTVDYTILKAGYAPIRVTGVSLSAESTPVAVQQDLDRAYAAPSSLTFGTNVIVNVTARVVTSLQVTTATTVQNWYSYLMDSWIASATNTTLKNVAFPVIPFGEASFTTTNGIEFSDGATSISKFKRDGFRYSSDAGVTATAIWSAILTLNTPAGQQVKYRQSPAGAITNASNTGPMDQLVQVYGDASHGNFDYRGHMVLRAPKVGWSQPKPDLVATYGNLVDGLFVAALEPVLQYATTDADIDAANLVLNNTTKTYTITAPHTMLELYQRAQWWANQDAQWDADIPLTTTNGGTFTQPSNWSMVGVANLTGGTLAGGTATLAAGTQGIAYNGVTLNLGAEGTYTATITSSTVNFSPTANAVTYDMGAGSFSGTIDLRNTHATRAITVQVPAGATTTTANNTGAAITVSAPSIARGITFTGLVAGSTVKVFSTGTTTELFSDTNSATSETWSESASGSRTVDYTIQKSGFLPIRVTGVTVTGAVTGGVVAVQIAQIQSRAYEFI